MTSFKPSTYSYGCSTYGDAGGSGATGGGVASTQAVARHSSGAIDSGTYSDTDGYSYVVSTSSITVYKKNGSVWKTVTPSDSLWDTMVSNLSTDYKAGKLRSGKATPQVKAPSTPSGGSGSSTDPGAGADTGSGEEPFYKKTWFPVAVIGGVLAIGILTYALWPSKT